MTIYRGRPFASAESQADLMKSHVTRGVDRKLASDGPRTPRLARPESWTTQAKCLDDFAAFDEPRGLNPGDAAKRCAGCPVIEECLSAALAEETGLSADSRYTIRGGLSPKERAFLEFSQRECENGHRGRWSTGRYGRCLECAAEREREAYRSRKDDPAFQERRREQGRRRRASNKISCLECRLEISTDRFPAHLGTHERSAA